MSRQRAQSIVEFGLIAPLFFLLVLGITDIGRATWAYNTVAFLAREDARRAEMVSDIAGFSRDRCQALLAPTCYVVVSPAAPPSLSANEARISIARATCSAVTVTYAFQPVTMMIANLIGTGILEITATSQFGVCQ
jgi:hypothetical protein